MVTTFTSLYFLLIQKMSLYLLINITVLPSSRIRRDILSQYIPRDVLGQYIPPDQWARGYMMVNISMLHNGSEEILSEGGK